MSPATSPPPVSTPLDRARAFLDRVPLVDGHNDLPWVIRKSARGDVAAYDLRREHQESDTDIPRLRRGKVSAQFWAAFVPTWVAAPSRVTLEQIDIARRIATEHPDVFLLATAPGDVAAARAAGRIASFVTVESGVGLENALGPLRIWHAAGVRLFTLCHNETLDWIDSATDAPRHGGLTRFGRAVVREANRLGIVVDLAHAAPASMHHVLDETRAPVVWSHSNAFSLCDHPRNVPDDVLDRVRANGGVVMVTFVPEFVAQASYDFTREFKAHGKTKPGVDAETAIGAKEHRAGRWPRGTIPELADHVDYLVRRIGAAHVGIGSDFYGGPTPEGLESVATFPAFVAELMRRGYSEAELAGIVGANVLRVMEDAQRIGAELSAREPVPVGGIADYDG